VSAAVTVLGSSGMFATLERACSGYLVDLDGFRLWMDAGAGTWRNLLDLIDYSDLDGIVLSHRHPDHTTDVYQAFHARHYGGREPLRSVPLWAPQETLDRLCAFGGELEQSFELRSVAPGDEIRLERATLSFFPMAHPPVTLGVRIEHEGGVLAYSADTGPTASFELLARRADVFVCEATLQDADDPWEGHMRASQSGRVASELEVPTLVLTHLPPHKDALVSLEQARASADGVQVVLAHDGMTIEVGS
jgi:ribonuclease BN (tRNA processing enzyme)